MPGYKQFANGAVLTADDVNSYLMSQVLVEVGSVAERDALPVRPRTVYRTDKEWAERYYPTWNATTAPKGVKTAGYYPIDHQPTFNADVPAATLAANTEYFIGATTGTPALPMTELEDFENWRAPSTNPSRITPNYEGVYRVTSWSQWNANATGYRAMRCRKNGAYVKAGQQSILGTGPAAHMFAQWTTEMNGTTDYLDLATIHTGSQDLGFSATILVEFVRPIHHG
ncbi:hypothetical protein [Frigoribacterium sp. VKM Ac-2836]|uniref:hypothetical protein n=1 Tax=Frigoribacterium sp. VKM Ac-2836 TaxID=2739014 RepID=UPI0015631B0E|nr:hypothetical protein [Frigoribacterium sp. VKM Ac-2836]NRD25556.1 hypothetical protein [Frigoribacterium sp. VKM Ac-2836]